MMEKYVAMAAIPGLFPHPDSLFITASEIILFSTGLVQLYTETNGINMGFSKFASGKSLIPSKLGMFIAYFPAALIASSFLAYLVGILPLPSILESMGASGLASFIEQAVIYDTNKSRLLLLASALSMHFIKRVLEVIFIHKYSGSMGVVETIGIISGYTSNVSLLLYSQILATSCAPPAMDMKWLGLALFLIGITGNGYHHYLLSRLRTNGSKQYVVPQGGLFNILVCPHYVFELLDFVGVALISQTTFGCSMTILSMGWLIGRSIATKHWYKKKVDGFPENRKILIPGVF